MTKHTVYVSRDEPICDLCSSKRGEKVRWSYSASADVEQLAALREGIVAHSSTGDWAACGPCGRLVERGSALALTVSVMRRGKVAAGLGRVERRLVKQHLVRWYTVVLSVLEDRTPFNPDEFDGFVSRGEGDNPELLAECLGVGEENGHDHDD